MPSLPHLVLGGIFGISLYYLSDKKFTKYHVFILFMNNLFGPDAGWVMGIGIYTHTLFGSIFFSLFLAILYHYITKFTIKIDSIKEIEVIELDKHQLSYINVYFLALAGNIMHNYLDGVINGGGEFKIFPSIGSISSITWSIDDFIALGDVPVIEINPLISFAIAMILYLGFIITFTYFIKKNTIKEAVYVLFHVVVFCIVFFLFGEMATTFHSDYGAILYFSLFWLIPIILCALSVREHDFLKERQPIVKTSKNSLKNALFIYLIISIITILEGVLFILAKDFIIQWIMDSGYLEALYTEGLSLGIISASIILITFGGLELLIWLKIRKDEKHDKNLIIISIWMFIWSVGGFAIAFLAIFFNEGIISIIISEFGEEILEIFTIQEVESLIIIVQILLIIIGIIGTILGLGLILKNGKIWKATIYYNLAISFTIVGIVVACYLSEDKVKTFFNSE